MECKDLKILWQPFCDGDLSAEMKRGLLAHFDECPACRAWDLKMRALENALEAVGEEVPETPPFLVTRVMAHIDEATQSNASGWLWGWMRQFSFPKLVSVSLVVAAFLGGMSAREVVRMVAPSALEQTVAAKKIVIEYKGAGEQEVGLVGDFNQWGKKNVPIAAKQVDGRWVFEIELAPGRYEYAFVINGKKWLPDPQAAGIIPDGFGGLNSVLYVHGQGDKTL